MGVVHILPTKELFLCHTLLILKKGLELFRSVVKLFIQTLTAATGFVHPVQPTVNLSQGSSRLLDKTSTKRNRSLQ